jgi:hypothetical protein
MVAPLGDNIRVKRKSRHSNHGRRQAALDWIDDLTGADWRAMTWLVTWLENLLGWADLRTFPGRQCEKVMAG